MTNDTKKRCPTCGETDISKFGSNRSRKDKLTTYCLSCKSKKGLETYYRHHDTRREAENRRRREEPERYRGYARTYYQRHREKGIAYSRLWKERNPEKAKAQRKRYQASPEYKAWRRAYEKALRQTPARQAYMHAYQRAYYRARKGNHAR
jgi:hypothetical protein